MEGECFLWDRNWICIFDGWSEIKFKGHVIESFVITVPDIKIQDNSTDIPLIFSKLSAKTETPYAGMSFFYFLLVEVMSFPLSPFTVK